MVEIASAVGNAGYFDLGQFVRKGEKVVLGNWLAAC